MALEQTRFTFSGLNPNDVATFIGVLILSLPLLLTRSRFLVWLVCPIEILLIALLVGTGSRGGVIALLAGMTVALLFQRQPSKWRGWKIPISVGLALLLGVSIGLIVFPKGLRLATIDISPEASAGRRLEVWATVPRMLASAPTGWGIGNSAEAYEQWFEPVGESVALKHLLSSHLTWLVEFGWLQRWLYIFFWMGAFALVKPSREFHFPVWGVAVWAAFLAALFYNAAGKWWNWPLPVVWLIAAGIQRGRQKTAPTNRYWILSALVASILVGFPLVAFAVYPVKSLPVLSWDAGNIILVGAGKPGVAILGPSKNVLGNFYGQEIRENLYKITGSIIIIGRPDDASVSCLSNSKLYLFSELSEEDLKKWELWLSPKPDSIVFLVNCRVEPDKWTGDFARVVYCHGEFFGDPYYNEWESLSRTDQRIVIKIAPQCETYISDWWSFFDEPSFK